MQFPYSTITALLLSAIYLPALAQNTQQNESYPPVEVLEAIVSSASGTEQDIINAPASISVVSAQEIKHSAVNNVTEAIQGIPGVNSIGGNPNERDISIRGLSGNYTLLMVNGRRQNTRESRPNGSGGFEAGFMPPLAAIERIEVVRGPMSSLYGSDAMGGIVNVITKDITPEWTGSLSLGGTVQENSDSGNSLQSNFFLSGPLIENTLGVQIYGGGDIRREDRILNGFHGQENKNIVGKLVYLPTENQTISLETGRSQQEKNAYPGKSIAATTTRGQYVQSNSKRDILNRRYHWSLTHHGHWDRLSSEFSVYQEQAKREIRNEGVYDSRRPEITNTVVEGKFVLPLGRHQITFGGQYQKAKLKDNSAIGLGKSSLATIGTEQKALFIEDEISLMDNLALTLGTRLDDHQIYGVHWSPRAYLVYHPSENFTMKGGVARAFRAPTLREISSAYGTFTQGGRAIMYGNPGLKPETSTSQELAFEYHNNEGYKASVTLFNTNFKDKLTSFSTGGIDPRTGLNLFTYDNVAKANIKGLELSAGAPLAAGMRIDFAYTYLNSKRQSDDERYASGQSLKGQPLEMTPKHSAYAKLSWQVNDNVDVYAKANYTGKQLWANQRNGFGGKGGTRYRDGFITGDVGGTYQFNKNTSVGFAVLNLGNQRMYDTSDSAGNWSIEDGRRYWLNLTMSY